MEQKNSKKNPVNKKILGMKKCEKKYFTTLEFDYLKVLGKHSLDFMKNMLNSKDEKISYKRLLSKIFQK